MNSNHNSNQTGKLSIRLTSTLSFVVLMLLMLLATVSSSQEKYWGPDTNFVNEPMSFGEAMDYAYENLEPHMNTDILVDRAPDGYSKRDVLDGSNSSKVCYWGDFHALYTRMKSSQIPYNTDLNFKVIDKISKEKFAEDQTILLGFIDYKYEEIALGARRNEVLQWVNNKVVVNDPSYPNILTEKRATAIAALRPFAESRSIKLKLDTSMFFSNVESSISMIELITGESDEILYPSLGETLYFEHYTSDSLMFTINVYYENGEQVTAKSVLYILDVEEAENQQMGLEKKSGRCFNNHLVYNLRNVLEKADRVKNLYVNPAPGYGKNTLKAKLGIYYGCGNECGPIRKPFIVCTGFGPFGGSKIDADKSNKNAFMNINGILGLDGAEALGGLFNPGMNSGANLLYKLKNEGFDIIIVDPDNGVDHLQNYAEIIKEAIEYVNHDKRLGGSYHENIIMGISMGAVAVRLALVDMENNHYADPTNNLHHHCRSFISYEGEMQGATIPLGLQAFVKHLTSTQPYSLSFLLLDDINNMTGKIPWYIYVFAPRYLHFYLTYNYAKKTLINIVGKVGILLAMDEVYYQLLTNPAAEGLLMHHIGVNEVPNDFVLRPHPYHTKLYSLLDSLGYPKDCRNVAIANGSNNGTQPNVNAGGPLIRIFDTDKKGNSAFIFAKLEDGVQRSTVFTYAYTNAGAQWSGTIRKDFDKEYSYSSGSYEGFYAHYVLPLAILKGDPIKDYSPAYRAPFVPVSSVFDIQGFNSPKLTYNVLDNLHYTGPNKRDPEEEKGYPHNNLKFSNAKLVSPFDAVFASKDAEFHVGNPSLNIVEFILDEVASKEVRLQNLKLKRPKEYGARYESRGFLELGRNISSKRRSGEINLDYYNKLRVDASEEIVIYPGFFAPVGSIFYATIRNMADSCYEFYYAPPIKRHEEIKNRDSQYVDEFGTREAPKKLEGTSLAIYPTITSGRVTIVNTEELGKVVVQDATGKKVHSRNIAMGESELNLTELSNGIYHVQFVGESHSQSFKILKQ